MCIHACIGTKFHAFSEIYTTCQSFTLFRYIKYLNWIETFECSKIHCTTSRQIIYPIVSASKIVNRLVYTSIKLLCEICSHIHIRVSRTIQPHLHIRKAIMVKKGSVISGLPLLSVCNPTSTHRGFSGAELTPTRHTVAH